MATFNSVQVTNKMPIPSHGDASSVKCQHFQVVMTGAGAAADIVNWGDLPDYAVPVEAILRGTAVATTLTVGIPADPNGLFDAVTNVANVPLRSALGTMLGRNIGRGVKRVTSTLNAAMAAGTYDLFIFYVVEDIGAADTGYPVIAAA